LYQLGGLGGLIYINSTNEVKKGQAFPEGSEEKEQKD